MRRSICITALLVTASLGAAAANDGVELRTKALASAGTTSVVGSNYVKTDVASYGRDPLSEIVRMESVPGGTGPQASCERSAGTVCFDAASGRIVYRGAREYMPKMSGFTAESVSVRHNAVVFKYTFE
jgi:hypothetical protein